MLYLFIKFVAVVNSVDRFLPQHYDQNESSGLLLARASFNLKAAINHCR